jgi:hypothetical protein
MGRVCVQLLLELQLLLNCTSSLESTYQGVKSFFNESVPYGEVYELETGYLGGSIDRNDVIASLVLICKGGTALCCHTLRSHRYSTSERSSPYEISNMREPSKLPKGYSPENGFDIF